MKTGNHRYFTAGIPEAVLNATGLGIFHSYGAAAWINVRLHLMEMKCESVLTNIAYPL